MKVRILCFLILVIFMISLFTGCVDGEEIISDTSAVSSSQTETEASVEYIMPIINDDFVYNYAKRSEKFIIENYNVTISLEYNEAINSFLGIINNQSGDLITDMVVYVIYDNGLSITKQIYSEIKLGESTIICPGTYVDPNRWRIEFSFNEEKTLYASGENSTFWTEYIGEVIPDDGVVLDGYRYAGKDQSYSLEKYGIKISAYFNSAYGDFMLYIENITEETIEDIEVGVIINDVKRTKNTEKITVEPDNIGLYGFSSYGQIFTLWRPVILNIDTGEDETKDEDTYILIQNSNDTETSKPDKETPASEENNWSGDIPKDIPRFEKGILYHFSFSEISEGINVLIIKKDISIEDVREYISKIKESGYMEIAKTDNPTTFGGVYQKGIKSLNIEFSKKYEEIKIEYIGD